jgi:demethylmenaquinone methyltransferase/2-methoxy-6-polyprenyl-1,4-benzoquinol methylase
MEPSEGKNKAGSGGQDPVFVRGAFARIARRYVLTNHVLSLGIDVLWRKRTSRLVAELKPRVVLDLATGSGDLAAEVQSRCPDAKVLGVDFSLPMLRQAETRGLKNLIVGDGMNLPVRNGSVDVVTVAFGLRNMASWSDAAKEMARVLKPGGSLFVLDFSLPQDGILRRGHLFYLRNIMPRIAGWLTGERMAYEYLCGSIEKFPAGEAMCDLLRQCGFAEAKAEQLSFGIASLYQAKK